MASKVPIAGAVRDAFKVTSGDESCPSLASDESSRSSDIDEPRASTTDEGLTIALPSNGKLNINKPHDRYPFILWLEHDPNPFYQFHGASPQRYSRFENISHFVAIQVYTLGQGEPSDVETWESAPVDAGCRDRNTTTKIPPEDRRNRSAKYRFKYQLSRDITHPDGSDRAGALLGFGVYDALLRQWDFKCYWFKRDPEAYEACALWNCLGERSVRTSHACFHFHEGHITEAVYQRLKHLERDVSIELVNVRGRERDIAMWREGYTIVYDDHRVVKDLLNPFIGELFTHPTRAEELLARNQSALTRNTRLTTIRPDTNVYVQPTSSDSPTAEVSLQQHRISSSESSPVSQQHSAPLPLTNEPALVIQALADEDAATPADTTAQPGHLIASILQQGQVVERVVHDRNANTITFHMWPPVDPRLTSSNDSMPFAANVDQVWPISPRKQSAGAPITPRAPSQRKKNRKVGKRPANLTTPRRVQYSGRNQEKAAVSISSPSVPSMTSGNTASSAHAGCAPVLVPRTPPSGECDPPGPQTRQMVLQETGQQDKSTLESEYSELNSERGASPPSMFEGC